MTQVKHSAMLKLELKDGAIIEVPRHLAELSKTICGTLELIDDDKPLSLPQLTEADWYLVHEPLALAYIGTTEKTGDARTALLASLRKLSASELLSCMKITDYLAVSVLFEACLELAYAGHMNALSYEQLSQLQPNYVEEIVFRRACAVCGPYMATQLAVCKGHVGYVFAVFVTPDGKIVSGSQDKTVRIWDSKGTPIAVGRGHEGDILAVSIAPNGTFISGSNDTTVRLWDKDGHQLAVCTGHKGAVNAVCVIHDGKIISGSKDTTVKIWDTDGNLIATGEGHQSKVTVVCVTPDGKIVSGSADGTVRIWDAEGKPLAVCEGHKRHVSALCSNADGTIISGSLDGTVRVWDTKGNQYAIYDGQGNWTDKKIVCITDNKVITNSQDGKVRVWDKQGNLLAECEHETWIADVCITPNGTLISGSCDGLVSIWETSLYLTDEQAKKVWLYLQENPALTLTRQVGWEEVKHLVSDANDLLTLELQGGIQIVVPAYLSELSEKIHDMLDASDTTLISLPFLTPGEWKLVHDRLALAHWSIAGMSVRHHAALLASLSELSADELFSCMMVADYVAIPLIFDACCELVNTGHLYACSYEQLMRLPYYVREYLFRLACAEWGPYKASHPIICQGHEDQVRVVCTTPDGKIISGSTDGTVRVWSANGKQLAICKGHTKAIYAMCISRDGSLVSGSGDGTLRIWDREGRELAICEGHKGRVETVCLTKDGKIVSGSADGTIRIWDKRGKQLAVCEGHEDQVKEVCVTKNGKIVSCSWDGTVRVWDLQGNQRAICRGHKGSVHAVCITRNDKIVSGSEDGTIRIWDREGNQIALCEGHESRVTVVCVSHDGKIVSGSDDGTIRIWDKRGKQLAVCKGHGGCITAVCVTGTGKIVSASRDNAVRVWDMRGDLWCNGWGKQDSLLAVCQGNENAITTVCATGNGPIVSGSSDGSVRIWDIGLTDEDIKNVWLPLQKKWEQLRKSRIKEASEELPPHAKN